MDLIKEFLRQYWLNLLAFGVFVVALARYLYLARWEHNLVPFAVALFGFVSVIASDEVADWTGRYGWNRQQWWQYPESVVRLAGGIALVAATVVLCLR